MTALYTLSGEITALLSAETDDGEIPATLAAQLDSLQQQFDEKVEAICRFRAGVVCQAHAVQEEIERLGKLHGRLVARANYLKDYIFRNMQALGVTRIDGTLFKCWVQRNGRPSITLAAGATIPEGFARVTTEFDAQRAYDVWRAGQTLPEAIKVVEGWHLRIQ